jgi:hypothetical protein
MHDSGAARREIAHVVLSFLKIELEFAPEP